MTSRKYIFSFPGCWYETTPHGCITHFPSLPLNAIPEDTPEYRATAERLGYGADTLLMCQEHELSHTLLSVFRGLPCSPTLAGVATGRVFPRWQAEEAMVLAFQECCRKSHQSIFDIARRYSR